MFKDKNSLRQAIHGDHNTQVLGDQVNHFHEAPSHILTRLPSLTSAAALRLAATIKSIGEPPPYDPKPYKIDHKIEYNAIKVFRSWIENFGSYGFAVEAAYDAVDTQDPGARTKILRHIRTKYTNIRTQLLLEQLSSDANISDESAVIRQYADRIINLVRQEILQEIKDSPEQGLVVEDLGICSNVITCHAFINCHILDRPPI